ncbi:hypothetical protein [Pantoea stewartii]|uniref:Phage protein n=1 Tax=Pantoea stewartii subsp. stewartii DC283 TaxID=660596 RepID=H3R874_PANSE|nr:hypothetical protein [Pantoea stewartii]ARF48861.1 hypothetical protein DSJ_05605 [Pantoea stewartii subsp. stewartii DC283]EHU02210.1 hypothetical protein CKS_5030 [Pantoea stewartii subsp. stewartii DC283]KAB0551631.1 hypothetical protein F7Q90_16930 [Pantoea stewartii subsp. stewartii]
MIKLPDESSPEDLREIAEYSLGIKLDDREPEIAHAVWLYCRAEVQRLNATAQPVSEGCKWTYDDDGYWDSACGSSWVFNDGGPVENECNFCQKCGGKVMLPAAPEGQDD